MVSESKHVERCVFARKTQNSSLNWQQHLCTRSLESPKVYGLIFPDKVGDDEYPASLLSIGRRHMGYHHNGLVAWSSLKRNKRSADKVQIARLWAVCPRQPNAGYTCRKLLGSLFGRRFESAHLHLTIYFLMIYIICISITIFY